MFKVLARLFGDNEERGKLVDGAIKGLDAIVFTEEEKAKHNAALGEWYLKYLQATQPQNLARRLIAIMVVLLWVFLIVVGVAFYIIEFYFSGTDKISLFIFRVLTEVVMVPFSGIMAFYFLTHTLRSVGKKNDS